MSWCRGWARRARPAATERTGWCVPPATTPSCWRRRSLRPRACGRTGRGRRSLRPRERAAPGWGRAGLPVAASARGPRSSVARAAPEDGIRLRVFREKDIPIQIALGNYDLGICGLAWVEDLIQRYPSDAVVPVRDLGLGYCSLYVAAAVGESDSLAGWAGRPGLRIVSEVPNLPGASGRR